MCAAILGAACCLGCQVAAVAISAGIRPLVPASAMHALALSVCGTMRSRRTFPLPNRLCTLNAAAGLHADMLLFDITDCHLPLYPEKFPQQVRLTHHCCFSMRATQSGLKPSTCIVHAESVPCVSNVVLAVPSEALEGTEAFECRPIRSSSRHSQAHGVPPYPLLACIGCTCNDVYVVVHEQDTRNPVSNHFALPKFMLVSHWQGQMCMLCSDIEQRLARLCAPLRGN